jgi:integrase
MTGTVYKRMLPSGAVTWAYSIYLGKDEQGKQIRKFKGGFATKREAEDERNIALHDLQNGLSLKPAPTTLREFLDEWLDQHASRKCTPKTVERYRQLLDYLQPALTAAQLSKVTTLALEREYSRLSESGGHDRKMLATRPLSARTVRHVADTVRTALNTAVRWKLLRDNPATRCDLPKGERVEASALDYAQLEWYLDAARGHWIYPVLVLASATGCRRGELLALTRSDYKPLVTKLEISKSLEQTKAGLRIKPPKNGKPRLVPLPPLAIEALEQHLAAQERNRELFGKDYRADLDLIFADPQGNYLKPDSVTATACLIARKAGLRGIGLHSLRHSHGSQMLSNGVPLPTVSKRLGHSSVHITAQVYAHSFTADEEAAASVWDAAMRKAMESRRSKQ